MAGRGRPAFSENMQRIAYVERFGLTKKQAYRLDDRLIRQLSRCKSDEARRLILNTLGMNGKGAV